MHILFIDESGGLVPRGKQGPKHFVLGGLIIPEEIWPKLAHDLKKIKNAYAVIGEIKWRNFIAGNKKPENSLRHLAPEKRDAMRLELYAAFTKYKSLRVISVIADVQRSYADETIENEDGLYQRSYKVLTERFQYFLQDLERTSGQKINGLIVCDHRNSREDSRLQQFHQKLVNSDNMFTSNYANLIEGLFVAPSHFSVGIQFADLVAGAVFRKIEAGDSRFFDIIKPLVRSGPNGRMEGYGLVKIPKGDGGA